MNQKTPTAGQEIETQQPTTLLDIFNSLPHKQKREYFKIVHGTVRWTTGFFDYWFHQWLGDFQTFTKDGKDYHAMIVTGGWSYESGWWEYNNSIIVHVDDKIWFGECFEYSNTIDSKKIHKPDREYKTVSDVSLKDETIIVHIITADWAKKEMTIWNLKNYEFEEIELSKLRAPDYLKPVQYEIKQALTNMFKPLPEWITFLEQKQKLANDHINQGIQSKDLFLIQKARNVFSHPLSYEQQKAVLDIVCEDIEKHRLAHKETINGILRTEEMKQDKAVYTQKIADLLIEHLNNNETLGESIDTRSNISSIEFILRGVKNNDLADNYLEAVMNHYINHKPDKAAEIIFFPNKNDLGFQSIIWKFENQRKDIFDNYITLGFGKWPEETFERVITLLKQDLDLLKSPELLYQITCNVLLSKAIFEAARDSRKDKMGTKPIDEFLNHVYQNWVNKEDLIRDISEWIDKTYPSPSTMFDKRFHIYYLLEQGLLSTSTIENIYNSMIADFPNMVVWYWHPISVTYEFFDNLNKHLTTPLDYKTTLFDKLIQPDVMQNLITKNNWGFLAAFLYDLIENNPTLWEHKLLVLDIAEKHSYLSDLFKHAAKLQMPSIWYQKIIQKHYDSFLSNTWGSDPRKDLCRSIAYAGLNIDKNFTHSLVQDLFEKNRINDAEYVAQAAWLYEIRKDALNKKNAEEAIRDNSIYNIEQLAKQWAVSLDYVQEVIRQRFIKPQKTEWWKIHINNTYERDLQELLWYAERYNIDLISLISMPNNQEA